MEYTSIYGYIKIDRDYEKSIEFLKSLGKDEKYPFINTNMFSFGDYEIPYYYEDMMLGFAATYKYFGVKIEQWNNFILKFENILRNVNFENAQLHVESSYGNYTLFWSKICSSTTSESYIENKLYKTSEWYFGFGRRSPFTGNLLPEIEDGDLREETYFDFIYPIPEQ